ncbi:MAG: hypothetical protein WBP00_01875, partial [Saprospiraceae bacterium]
TWAIDEVDLSKTSIIKMVPNCNLIFFLHDKLKEFNRPISINKGMVCKITQALHGYAAYQMNHTIL